MHPDHRGGGCFIFHFKLNDGEASVGLLKSLKCDPCSWGTGGLASDTLPGGPEDRSRLGRAPGAGWRDGACAGLGSGACLQWCVRGVLSPGGHMCHPRKEYQSGVPFSPGAWETPVSGAWVDRLLVNQNLRGVPADRQCVESYSQLEVSSRELPKCLEEKEPAVDICWAHRE